MKREKEERKINREEEERKIKREEEERKKKNFESEKKKCVKERVSVCLKSFWFKRESQVSEK